MKEDFHMPFYIQRFHQSVSELGFNILLLWLLPNTLGLGVDTYKSWRGITVGNSMQQKESMSVWRCQFMLYSEFDIPIRNVYEEVASEFLEVGRTASTAPELAEAQIKELKEYNKHEVKHFKERHSQKLVEKLHALSRSAKSAAKAAERSPFKSQCYIADDVEIAEHVALTWTTKETMDTMGNMDSRLRGVYAKEWSSTTAPDAEVRFCKVLEAEAGDSSPTVDKACWEFHEGTWKLRLRKWRPASGSTEGDASKKEDSNAAPKGCMSDAPRERNVAKGEWAAKPFARDLLIMKSSVAPSGVKLSSDGTEQNLGSVAPTQGRFELAAGEAAAASGAAVEDVILLKGKYGPGLVFKEGNSGTNKSGEKDFSAAKPWQYICDPIRCSDDQLAGFSYLTTHYPFYTKKQIQSGMAENGYQKGFMSGWSLGVYLAILSFSFYYGMSAFVVKRLSAVWRTVAMCVTTLVLFYSMDMFVNHDPQAELPPTFNLSLAAFLTIGSVIMYVVLKQEAKDSDQLPVEKDQAAANKALMDSVTNSPVAGVAQQPAEGAKGEKDGMRKRKAAKK
jgi:hypothetical protein